MKFKVGDKVVVSPKANPLLGGLSGIVVETQESPIADTAYYKVDLDEERVFPEHHLIAETEYRFLTGLNATAHQLLATCGIKAADSDTKVLRAKDGTIIGDFSTGGTVSIHDQPTSEWYNPMRLVFKNGSSIEALPQKDDAVRGKNHFCTGFRGGKIPTPEKPVSIEEQLGLPKGVSIHDLPTSELIKKEFNVAWLDKIALPTATETKEMVERVRREILEFTNAFPKEEKKLKFTFYTVDTSRINKTNNTKVDTIMTCVHIGDKVGYATCDKEDYDEREGILNAIANLCCDGSFDKAYRKAVKEKKISETLDCTCSYCRKVFDTIAEREAHEAWHIERRKARHERYLLRKRAKEIAFEEQAQKMAKEIIKEDK